MSPAVKKGLIAVSLLVIVIICALPYVNGIINERLVYGAFQQMNNRSGEISFSVVDESRGYAHTQMTWQVDPGTLGARYGIGPIRFTDRTVHGLWGVSSETVMAGGPLTIQRRIPYFGPATVSVTLDTFSAGKGETALQSGPMALHLSLDKDMEAFSASGAWETGRMGKNSLSGAGIKLRYRAAPGTDRADLFVTMAADRVQTGSRTVSELALEFSMLRVDRETLGRLSVLCSELIAGAASELADPALGAEERAARLRAAAVDGRLRIMEEGEGLLKKDFEVRVDRLAATLPGGKVFGRLEVALKRDISLAASLAVLFRPALALDMVTIHSRFFLPGTLSTALPGLTRPLFPGMKTGLFVPGGNRLSFWAETRDNRLYLNGYPVAL